MQTTRKEVDVPITTAAAVVTPITEAHDPPGELETLFRENYNQVYRTAYRITGSTSDAEDVLQTVFLRLARRDEQYALQPNPAAYLHRAAVNAALDLIRRRKRTASTTSTDAGGEAWPASPQKNPEEQHADRELRELIRAGVARLGERAAEVFTLRYVEGYDNREIAALIGTSQAVVAVTLHRSRGQLRKEIGKYLEGHHVAQS